MVTMHVPGCLRNAARSVAERSGRNLPATDIDPATEGTCADLGQSGPHMATGLPHPWHIRPMAEPLRPGQNSRCERGMWTAAVNAACHVVRVRCHDRETTPWRSRSQARGHVRQTGQDGGGVASQARIAGRGAPAPIHGEPNNRNHPFLCKKPDLVDRHPTSPNQTQPVSGCQRLGSCEPTRSTGISARHVESAMILAGSQRSA